MAEVFYDNGFWKSRFNTGWPQAFLEVLIAEQEKESRIEDWRQLYHLSAGYRSQSDTALRVWETVQWIRESLEARATRNLAPRSFYGRALQYYHGDSAIAGRRIERVSIDSPLLMVGISLVSGRDRCEQGDSGSVEAVTEIVALEFVHADGRRVTVGNRTSGATERTGRGLSVCLKAYKEKRGQNIPAQCPFDSPGVHVLLPVREFRGFRIRYNEQGIYAVGVLQRLASQCNSKCRSTLGFVGIRSCLFDMALDRVDEVVVTFQGQRLVDLRLRGAGNRLPLAGRGLQFPFEWS
ncbi:hypothetical protein BJX70DRAFT_394581 [Aspergillus crustosus]